MKTYISALIAIITLATIPSCAKTYTDEEDCENTRAQLIGEWTKGKPSEVWDHDYKYESTYHFNEDNTFSEFYFHLEKDENSSIDTISSSISDGNYIISNDKISIAIISSIRKSYYGEELRIDTSYYDLPRYKFSYKGRDPDFCIKNDELSINYTSDFFGIPTSECAKFYRQ